MSRSQCSSWLIAHVLFLVLCWTVMTSASECVFPVFMTRMSRWETHVTSERTQIGAMWTFPTRSQAQVVDIRSRRTTTFSCHTAISHETFLTSIPAGGATANTSSASYQCLRFIRRSDFVVQLARSDVHGTSSPVQCFNSAQFQVDDWILVCPDLTGAVSNDVSCGLVGGYWLSVIDSSGSPTCRDSFLRPIIEADCVLPGEGMLIDFRQPTCALLSDTVTSHQLVCLGSWTQSGSVFSILSDNKRWQRLWMLKIPEGASGPITAHLMKSLSTSPAHNNVTDQYALSLTPAYFPTLCENEASGCDVTHCADDTTELYCQKTCDACAVATSGSSCQFNDSDRGQWLEMSHRHDDDADDDANRFVTV